MEWTGIDWPGLEGIVSFIYSAHFIHLGCYSNRKEFAPSKEGALKANCSQCNVNYLTNSSPFQNLKHAKKRGATKMESQEIQTEISAT